MTLFEFARGHAGQNFGHLVGIGPGSDNSVLGTTEFSGRHHFHSLGNLLRVFNRADPLLDILQICHQSTLGLKLLGNKLALKFFQCCLDTTLQIGIDGLFRRQIIHDITMLASHERQQLGFITADRLSRIGINIAIIGSVNHHNLLGYWQRLILPLLENLNQTLTALQLPLGSRIEV